MMTYQELRDEIEAATIQFGLLYEARYQARERYASLETFSTLPEAEYLRVSHELAAEIAGLEREIDTVNRHLDNLQVAEALHPDGKYRRFEVIEGLRLGR